MDGLAVFDSSICSPNENDNSEQPDAYIAVVEIKTAVGSVTLARGIEHATVMPLPGSRRRHTRVLGTVTVHAQLISFLVLPDYRSSATPKKEMSSV